MKTKIVEWTETHHYEKEVDVPDDLETNEDIFDYITYNSNELGLGTTKPYEISTDWDSFKVFDKEDTK